ncbi:hypothetical protein G9Q38_13105 [Pusillimonas sp. DMV24BSW_D]|uniref:DUF5677 domain-containing protein n=1 Tax=Neopusillimonas aestuarii TaxID=2716226 RepID=UPI00140C23F8|nr:DUF5677 domain-containing protein [Pusillimonas sp. DMV24BSW_D]QIM50042.1 hypothetical protein G9Q38_13105 [Pusillimonas sp. DMV24BSW_D]
MTTVSTDAGSQLLAKFLDGQIKRLVESVNAINESDIPRVARLVSLYSAVIEDVISIRILCENARINQAYIVSRALLERLTNFCFLQLCTAPEFSDYVDYSLNKAGRSLDRSIEANGKVKARIALNGGDFELPPEISAAIAKFTSERGREKTRWTNVSLPDRAAVIEAKLGNTGLFMSLLTIYADASEALHGTLYGAAFHLGAYKASPPHDQASLDQHRHQTLSALYLMAGGGIDTLFSLLASLGDSHFKNVALASQNAFKEAAIATGLAVSKEQ